MPFSSGCTLRKRAQKDWFLLFSQHNTSLMFSFVGKEIMTEGKKSILMSLNSFPYFHVFFLSWSP